MTDAEQSIWKHLRMRQIEGCKFRRQYNLGDYIVDFACLERRLIIEVDGGQHSEQAEYDTKRDEWLRQQGFRVLRFWDNDVLIETDGVLETIRNELTPPPQSSPARGEEEEVRPPTSVPREGGGSRNGPSRRGAGSRKGGRRS
jgi:very-short-patch-repair endonuclease